MPVGQRDGRLLAGPQHPLLLSTAAAGSGCVAISAVSTSTTIATFPTFSTALTTSVLPRARTSTVPAASITLALAAPTTRML